MRQLFYELQALGYRYSLDRLDWSNSLCSGELSDLLLTLELKQEYAHTTKKCDAMDNVSIEVDPTLF
jgi:hypothetical protein